MRTRRWWSGLLLGLAVLVAVATLDEAAACSIPPPEPWFREQVTIPPIALPPGVEIRVGGEGDTLEFRNQSDTELLIVGELHGVFWDDSPEDFPQAGAPPRPVLHRIVNGQVFSWGWVIPKADDEPITERQWERQLGPWGDLGVIAAAIDWGSITTGEALLAEYVNDNRIADGRPADVPLPPAQTVAFQLVYGSDPIDVPVTIQYSLNPAYDPEGQRRYDESLEECSKLMSAPPEATTAQPSGRAAQGLCKVSRWGQGAGGALAALTCGQTNRQTCVGRRPDSAGAVGLPG